MSARKRRNVAGTVEVTVKSSRTLTVREERTSRFVRDLDAGIGLHSMMEGSGSREGEIAHLSTIAGMDAELRDALAALEEEFEGGLALPAVMIDPYSLGIGSRM
jgi:hypothetical protein